MTGTKNAAVKSRKKKRGPGQPTKMTPPVMRRICDNIKTGCGVEAACKDKNGEQFADWKKFYLALERVREYREMYTQACITRADVFAEQARQIADDNADDIIKVERVNRAGEVYRVDEVPNTALVLRDKLRVETRLKLMEKMAPRKYGPKMEVAGDPDRPLNVTAAVAVVAPSMEAFRESLRQVIAGKKPEKAP